MMTKEELYQSKMITLDEALEKIKSHDTIAAGHYGNEPREFLRKVHTIADRVEYVTIWINNPSEVYPFITDEALKDRIDILSCFHRERFIRLSVSAMLLITFTLRLHA